MSHDTFISYLKNFPLNETPREKQYYVLREIAAAFTAGYKIVVVGAPTGLGKSAVAISVARTEGSSHIVTSTKDLQFQYANDFHYVKMARGKDNFICEVKDDFIKLGTYRCKTCDKFSSNTNKNFECTHTTVKYGTCMSKKDFECDYKMKLKYYHVVGRGTVNESVYLSQDEETRGRERHDYSHDRDKPEPTRMKPGRVCKYFHEFNTSLTASHSVLNYAMFFAVMGEILPSRASYFGI